jgi:single-stranded DNA-specific DHH superfamily exonuclease
MGNSQPLFLMRRLPLRATRVLKDKHLKLLIGRDRVEVEAVWWNAVEYHAPLAAASHVSLMCRLEINAWNGRESCQLNVADAAVEM